MTEPVNTHTRPRKKFWDTYRVVYGQLFAPLRDQPITLLELGIGGYDNPHKGGESLRVWAEYFTAATIIGLDRHPKQLDLPPRVVTYTGSQTDVDLLTRIAVAHKGFDVVIDDASHIAKKTIRSFEVLWPHTRCYYVVEDLHGSYGRAYNPKATEANEYFARVPGATLHTNMAVMSR